MCLVCVCVCVCVCVFFFLQGEDGIRDAQESRGLGDVYKRQELELPAVQVGDIVILGTPLDRDIAQYLVSTGMKIAMW